MNLQNDLDLNIDLDIDDLLEDIKFIKGDIRQLLQTKQNINILWGVQPRTMPNIEFIIAIIQIVKFIKRGYCITVLLADIHEMLDTPKLSLNILEYRCNAYIELIRNLVELFDVNSANINFIFGSSYQTSKEYTLDLYKISSLTTIEQIYNSREINIKDVNSEVNSESSEIEDSDNKMTSMLYPILQALDEKYTNCDIFYGSITQKNMCIFSDILMKKYYNNNTVYLLQDLTHKIDISFFDPLDAIKNKIDYFEITKLNYLIKHLLFPLLQLKNDKIVFNLIEFNNYDIFINYINDNNDNNINNTILSELTSTYLSKHLDKLYYTLLGSKFMYWYNKGFIGICL
jgi:hypothetical protein